MNNLNGNGTLPKTRGLDLPEYRKPELAEIDLTDLNQQAAPEKVPSKNPEAPRKRHMGAWIGAVALIGLAAGATYFGPSLMHAPEAPAAVAQATPVVVGTPIAKEIEPQLQFLGQFSAIEHVEVRAQVGGILTQIGFKDGDIVKKGDLLFAIDTTPYEIKLAQATAQLETSKARLDLANSELVRAKNLQQTGAMSSEELESRAAAQLSAQATLDDAQAAVRDAQFDLDHCKIVAPFTGRIGTHMVSVGNLIAGSRAATSPTTLLATIDSVDSIYLNFDMSEADYMAFLRQRTDKAAPLADKVMIALADEKTFSREGTLDFVDNTLDRSSGTIHARATLSNKDLLLTPGGFARVRVAVGEAAPALLVPDAAVLNDQSSHIVMTVDADNTVVAKVVELGDLHNGLRVIRSGLSPTDRVIIQGILYARPGAKVAPSVGAIQEKAEQVAVAQP